MTNLPPSQFPTYAPPIQYPPATERADVVKDFISFIGFEAQWYKVIICPGPKYRVIGEQQQFVPPSDVITLDGFLSLIGATTDWTQPGTHITQASVSVQDSSGIVTYVINKDYTVDYDGGQITRLDTGTIPSTGNVLVNYTWKEPDISPSTGNPRIDCPICEGEGRIFASPVSVMGLMHVPQFNSPLTELGYFRFGDCFFTVAPDTPIGITSANDAHLLIRDKVIVNNREYRVMAEGSTLNMQDEVLGIRLHLRLLEIG